MGKIWTGIEGSQSYKHEYCTQKVTAIIIYINYEDVSPSPHQQQKFSFLIQEREIIKLNPVWVCRWVLKFLKFAKNIDWVRLANDMNVALPVLIW